MDNVGTLSSILIGKDSTLNNTCQVKTDAM